MSSLRDIGVSEWLSNSCSALNIIRPTDIQVKAIPRILRGEDVIGQARTGSGKTACFGLPIIQKLASDPFGVFALIILPNRELAQQVGDHFTAIGAPMNISVCVATGGQDIMKQQIAIQKRPHILVATPGRLAEVLRMDNDMKKIFKYTQFLVLDEADRLLEECFQSDLDIIFNALPHPTKRQTLLFTATLSDNVEIFKSKMETEHSNRMVIVKAAGVESEESPDTIAHMYLFQPAKARLTHLHYLLLDHSLFNKDQGIIFVRTKYDCELLGVTLQKLGHSIAKLHSGEAQRIRSNALGKFKSESSRILIATDVASRGLDIPTVGWVINYDVPNDNATYIHRVGRAGRAGRVGIACSLVREGDAKKVLCIEERLGKKLDILSDFDEDDALRYLKKVSKTEVHAQLLLDESGFAENEEVKREKLRKQKMSREAELKHKSEVPADENQVKDGNDI